MIPTRKEILWTYIESIYVPTDTNEYRVFLDWVFSAFNSKVRFNRNLDAVCRLGDNPTFNYDVILFYNMPVPTDDTEKNTVIDQIEMIFKLEEILLSKLDNFYID